MPALLLSVDRCRDCPYLIVSASSLPIQYFCLYSSPDLAVPIRLSSLDILGRPYLCRLQSFVSFTVRPEPDQTPKEEKFVPVSDGIRKLEID